MSSYRCSMRAFLSSSSLVDISEFVLYVLYWAKINTIWCIFVLILAFMWTGQTLTRGSGGGWATRCTAKNRNETAQQLPATTRWGVYTDYSRTMTISCWSSKASCRLSSLGWCRWFMTLISFLTVFLSSGYGVLMNLATKLRPVDFSTARCTTPNAPLYASNRAS